MHTKRPRSGREKTYMHAMFCFWWLILWLDFSDANPSALFVPECLIDPAETSWATAARPPFGLHAHAPKFRSDRLHVNKLYPQLHNLDMYEGLIHQCCIAAVAVSEMLMSLTHRGCKCVEKAYACL